MKADNGPERVQTRDEADKLNESGGVAVGDTVQVVRVLRDPVPLKVVGIAQQPPLGGTPWSYMTVEGVAWISGKQDRLSRIEVVLKDGVDPEAFVARRAAELPPTVLLQTTEKSTSNLNRNLRANQLGFFAATMMAFIAAAFIIATGMATGVTERQRELAILRCIGAERRQLVLSQLLQGLIIGAAGAIIGVPIGVACAAFMVERYRDVLQAASPSSGGASPIPSPAPAGAASSPRRGPRGWCRASPRSRPSRSVPSPSTRARCGCSPSSASRACCCTSGCSP